MPKNNNNIHNIREYMSIIPSQEKSPIQSLPKDVMFGGGDGEGPYSMEQRVTRLEALFEHNNKVLDTNQRQLEILPTLATRAELNAVKNSFGSNLWQISLVCTAVAAIVIASIIGGLGWLETRASRIQTPPQVSPQPIVIQLPAQR
jgi:hypothetical protein